MPVFIRVEILENGNKELKKIPNFQLLALRFIGFYHFVINLYLFFVERHLKYLNGNKTLAEFLHIPKVLNNMENRNHRAKNCS